MGTPIVPETVMSLAGMTVQDVRRALGDPDAQTDKGAQRVWTYAGAGCSVEVIFFLDVTRSIYAALDHKTLGPYGRAVSTEPCLQPNAEYSSDAP